MATTIAELRDSLLATGPKLSDAYKAKQLHPVPPGEVVKRDGFILDCAKGQVVVDVGASGPLHEQVKAVAATYYGLDKCAGPQVDAIDFDAYDGVLPPHPDATLVVCGELLEHLSNPGWFLDRLRAAYPVLTIFTVPNAFAAVGLGWLNKGIENVNADHVAYYSAYTITNLLQRHGYSVQTVAWYNGHPKFAEGLIVVAHG